MKKIIALAAAFAALTLLAACSPKESAATPQSGTQRIILEQSEQRSAISVSATAEVTKEPDVAYAYVEVITYAKTSKAAQEDNAKKMQEVLNSLTGFGISKEDMETSNFSLSPVYDWVNNRQVLSKYECRNSLKLTIEQIDKVGEILDVAGQGGANSIYGISFSLLDNTAAQNEALAKAVENAKARAQTIADSAGVKLGKAVSISESGYSSPVQPYYEYKALADNAAERSVATTITPGDLTITAYISASFEIE